MVTRVSTAGNYSAILANLIAAENRQVDAENRVSSQKNGANLKDYANKAETLTAMYGDASFRTSRLGTAGRTRAIAWSRSATGAGR